MVSVSPSVPNTTSWWATSPAIRSECTCTPSTLAPRAPSSDCVVASGPGPSRRAARAAAMSSAVRTAVPLGASILFGVVQLDDLGRLVVPRGELRELHRQDRTDGEVRARRARPTCGLSASQSRIVSQALLGDARGADDGVDALVDREANVVHHDVRVGEVDEHLGAGVGHAEQPVPRVDHRDQVEVRRGIDRLADLLTHPAAGAEHPDPYRAHSSGLLALLRPRRRSRAAPNGPTTVRQRGWPAVRPASSATSLGCHRVDPSQQLVDAQDVAVDQFALADPASSASRSPPGRARSRPASDPCRARSRHRSGRRCAASVELLRSSAASTSSALPGWQPA